jgi:NTE family protein
VIALRRSEYGATLDIWPSSLGESIAMTDPKIGIALGSGSARGWSHIGVIRALEEANVSPQIVSGTSMGALVGGAYAADRLEPLAILASKFNWQQMMRLLDVNLTSGGVIQGARLKTFFDELFDDNPIEELQRSFLAVATDFRTGREVWIKRGSLAGAVRASIAIPGIFSPVKLNNRWLMDGGLTNPVPVSAARALGADLVIAVNLNAEILPAKRAKATKPAARGRFQPVALEKLTGNLPKTLQEAIGRVAARLIGADTDQPSYFDVIVNAINIMQDQITRSRLAGEPPDITINPKVAHIRLLEFDRGEEAIEAGYRAAKQALPAIHETIAGM